MELSRRLKAFIVFEVGGEVTFLRVEWEDGRVKWRRFEIAFEGLGEELSSFAGQL